MKRVPVAGTAFVLALAVPVGAAPPDNAVTIGAAPASVPFGKPVVISGQVTGSDNAGVSVTLEGLGAPYSGGFATAGSATTDAAGAYRFAVVAQQSTRYRVDTKTKPKTTSPEVAVAVRLRVGLSVSDPTPRRGRRIRFSGKVTPARDGRTAELQKRTAAGWRTVKTAALVAATPLDGAARSTYRLRARVRRTAVYRVFVSSGDAIHADGWSRKRRVRVH